MGAKTRLASVSVVFAILLGKATSASSMRTLVVHSDSSCTSTPDAVIISDSSDCSEIDCGLLSNTTLHGSITCTSEEGDSARFTLTKEAFGDTKYVFLEFYTDQSDCDDVSYVNAYPTWERCTSISATKSIIASAYSNGSASLAFFQGTTCADDAYRVLETDGGTISSTECYKKSSTSYRKLYSSMSISSYLSGSTGSSNSGSSSAVDSAAESGSSDPDTPADSDSITTDSSADSGSSASDASADSSSSENDSSGEADNSVVDNVATTADSEAAETSGEKGGTFSVTTSSAMNSKDEDDSSEVKSSGSNASNGGSTANDSNGSSGVAASQDTGKPSISGGTLAGIIAGAVVLVIVLLAIFFWCRGRHREKRNKQQARADADVGGRYIDYPSPSTGQNTTGTGSLGANAYSQRGSGPRGIGGLWEDDVITTARIPREKVLIRELVSHGGFGEVYEGRYNRQRIAVKMLLPAFRKNVEQLNAFLAEVKLMATLDHPRIITFVGVAWDSLTDLCAVSEFMEGGDLRALLDACVAENHPVGFDRTKVTIAMHVAHALAYLHSLVPPVLHRDLKSRNVLLSSSMDAKLTDFGASRARVDGTMTAGVGTMLWMAPEVMMGQKYDDKADMFSFGVLLSELDMQTLPYAHGNEMDQDGDRLPEAAILQRVAMGRLTVAFSRGALASVVTLGKACVSLDPKKRPTAAEVLYRLHKVLGQRGG